jgi:hypothetical protein
MQNNNIDRPDGSLQALLKEWRLLHPEFTDAEFDEAMQEIRVYLRLAWTAYRQQHPNRDLPDAL